LPVEACPDRSGCLRVRAPFGQWPHGHECERRGGFRRPPGVRKECGNCCVRLEGTARVSHAHVRTPVGERGAGHLDGLLRNDVMGWSVQGHRKPPGVGFDSTGKGTVPAIHHPGGSLSAEQRRSQAGPHSGFASDSLARDRQPLGADFFSFAAFLIRATSARGLAFCLDFSGRVQLMCACTTH
jgi:hypothetical protein